MPRIVTSDMPVQSSAGRGRTGQAASGAPAPRVAAGASGRARPPRPEPTPASRHIRVIDGLRALAVVGVIGYHTRPSMLVGGFLGVTVFFVITGFLLTRSMLNLFERLHFSYPKFLVGRARRIWPSVLATIALTALLSYAWAPSLLAKVRGDALPSALFYSNWSFVLRKLSYFQASGLPSPLTHLWFTSLIMQFYVLWPLLFVVVFQLCRRRRTRAAAVGALIALSTLEMALLYHPGQDTSRLYYGLDTRAAELLVGALLAVLLHGAAGAQDDEYAHDPPSWRSWSRVVTVRGRAVTLTAARLVDALGFALLAVLVACLFAVDAQGAWLYRGGYLLIAAMGALMIWCGMHGGLFMRAMSGRALAYLGSRSFSLYLVHYPLLLVMNPATRTTPVRWWEWIGQFLVILVAGEVFFQLVEAMRGTPWLPWGARPRAHADAVRAAAVPRASMFARLGMSRPELRAGFARAGAAAARVIGRLRPGAVVGALAGALAVVLLLLPLPWASIAHARAVALRPELAMTKEQAARRIERRPAAPSASPKASASAGASPSPTPRPQAHALKVPANLDPSRWSCDAGARTCDARVLVIGDSVTEAVADALRQRFPNADVDGAVGRQFAAGVDLLAQRLQAGADPQVIVFALGTNGAATGQDIDRVVALAAGRPLYFVTTLAPVAWTAGNNDAFVRTADAHKDVGVIDWSGLAGAHPEYLYDDGTHPNELGAQAYGQLVDDALCPR